MKTDAQRNDAYVAKTVPATVGLKVAAVLSGMKTNFATAIDDLVPIEMSIQTVLNGADVPTIQYPFYLCFGRQIWKRRYQGIDGDSLNSVAQSLHDKWEAAGLATAVLVEIADTVFGITVT
jgi:hypothetical protein